MGVHDRGLRVYLVSVATVLGGEDEGRQVTGQLQPPEVPHQVPEDDGVMVHNTRGGDGLVALVHQQALQLFPQDQRTQVGHRHRGQPCPLAAPLFLPGTFRELSCIV